MSEVSQYSPLFPLLEKYWGKPLSELPNDLQKKVRKAMGSPTSTPDPSRVAGFRPKFNNKGDLDAWETIHVDTQQSGDIPLDWDELTPEQRQSTVAGFDYSSDPSLEEERKRDRKTTNEILRTQEEIERWEGMSNHGKPSEAAIREERLAQLKIKSAQLNNQLSATENQIRNPVAKQQGDAILKWLHDNKYDPKQLPKAPKGKAGVKRDCRNAFCEKSTELFLSKKVFDTAWQSLRDNHNIKDKL